MKVGVIGVGSMGENHARVYSSLPSYCHLVGVFDSNKSRSKEVAEKYNIQSFDLIEDLLQQVDAVSIAVPTELHYKVAKQCIQSNVHILVEKAIANTVDEARELVTLAKKTGVQLQVGHIELFNPTIRVLKEILKQEQIIAIDIQRMSPLDKRVLHENVVKDLMIHDIYILFDLLNDIIKDFYTIGSFFEQTIKHAIAISKFKNGVIAQLTASYKTKEKVRSIRIVTEEAFIQADLLSKTIQISRSANSCKQDQKVNYIKQNVIEKVAVPEKEPLKLELKDFLTCLKNNSVPSVTGEDGICALKFATQISDQITTQEKK